MELKKDSWGGIVRVCGGEEWLRRWSLEFGVKSDGQTAGRSQQKQMIHTYLRIVKLAPWFREAKFLGRELLYNKSWVPAPDNEKRNKRGEA